MNRWVASIIILLVSNVCVAQVDSSYLIYKKQFADLVVTRSGTESEAGKALESFNKNQITSNQSFAKFLEKVYPTNKGIGVLLFFFHNNSLKRIFFEPGKVLEEKSIAITGASLMQLQNDIHSALKIAIPSTKRAPRIRGGEIKNITAKNIKLPAVLKKFTELIVPKTFNSRFKHLIVVPAFNLGVLPFHLLQPFGNKTYLIDQCSFTIAPTLVDLVGLRYEALFNVKRDGFDPTMSQQSFNDLQQQGLIFSTDSMSFSLDNPLFISNPAYPTNDKYTYPNLPGAEQEIENAIPYAKKYTLLKGKDALKDSVLKYLNGADVAYFATHAIASEVNPDDNSYLVLSGRSPYLTSLEIKDFRFKENFTMPEMVILSACQTGLGKFMEAGVMGSLARAFLLAGSNHVIMSLWNVDDNATAYLMNRFIHHLRTPSPFMPAGQLRNAILDTKKKFPNPAHWASFSMFGVNY